jgi:hypothetical protein
VLKSMVCIGFWNPPVCFSFNAGGGLECVIKIMHRSVVESKARRSMVQGIFRTPSTDLPLTVVGGGPEWSLTLAGPLSIRGMNLLVPSPTASYCLTYLVTSDIIIHLSKRVTSHNSVSPSPSFTRGKSPHHDFFPQSITATSPICIPQSLSPAISHSK